jgi:N-acetylglucosamine kinase-like BadF-type ATPase
MGLFLAIDAGGTKTTCLLADETRILGRASTGSIKLMRVGQTEATARLRTMLSELSMASGVGLGEVTRTCIGLAGFTIAAVREWAEREIGDVVGGDLVLCGDEEIALEGAFSGGPGILIIAGTGSNFIGRAADGTKYCVGGWGPALGDEGSGFWIGQEALRAGFWAKDHCVSTILLREIGEFWGTESLGEIVEKANERPGPDFAALAPIVTRCAAGGDELARAVLERAGEELAEQVALVALKMSESGSQDEIGVAYTGGVLEHIVPVRRSLIAALKQSTPQAKVMEGAADSLKGALWKARGGGLSPAKN